MYKLTTFALTTAMMLSAQVAGFNKAEEGAGKSRPESHDALSKTRQALGGEERLQAIRTVRASGTFRRALSGKERTGDFDLYFMSPSRYKKIEAGAISGDAQMTLVQVLNQDQAWSRVNLGVSDVQVAVGPGNANSESQGSRKQLRADFTRHLLALLLASPASGALTITEAGDYNLAGVQTSAFDLKGPDEFAARIFVDAKTFLPVRMSYVGRPAAITVTQAEPAEVKTIEKKIDVTFSDYRPVGGVMLPHRFRAEADGALIEEFETREYHLNSKAVTAHDFDR
jgi:hypothetical protein